MSREITLSTRCHFSHWPEDLVFGNKSIEKADFVKSERRTQAFTEDFRVVLLAELFIVKQKYGPEIARH